MTSTINANSFHVNMLGLFSVALLEEVNNTFLL